MTDPAQPGSAPEPAGDPESGPTESGAAGAGATEPGDTESGATGAASAAPSFDASPADQRWNDLASQLTPAASLARIDNVTSRAVTTITVIGLLLTGLGVLAAGQFARHGAARDLAVAAVLTATLSVASALSAQVLTITRELNPDNLIEVRAWYHRQFNIRARATRAATILLIFSSLLAGATAATTLLTTPH